jgi:hypothetical protein
MAKKQIAYVTTQVVAVDDEKVQIHSHVSIQEQLERFTQIIVDIYLETENGKIDQQAD